MSAAGGGELAAAALADAAELVERAAIQSSTYADARGAAAQAAAIARRSRSLGLVNTVRYDAARQALAGEIAEQRPEARHFLVGKFVSDAAEPPLALSEAAADLASLAAEVAKHCDEQARLDCIAAAAVAAGTAEAAAALVAGNLVAGTDDARAGRARRAAERARESASAAR